MPEQSRHSQKTVVTAVWQLLQMLQMVGRHALGALSNELVELAGLVFPLFSIRQSRLASGDDLPSRQPCQLNVEVNHMLLVGWNIFFRLNCANWTLWNADRAVNAFIRVNGQKIRAFTKGINRANINAIGVLAADTSFGYYVGHSGKFPNQKQKSARHSLRGSVGGMRLILTPAQHGL